MALLEGYVVSSLVILLCLYGIVRLTRLYRNTSNALYLLALGVLFLGAADSWLSLHNARVDDFFANFESAVTFLPLAAFFGYNYLDAQRHKEKKEKLQIRSQFSKYVSPKIVEEIVSDPNLKLGGERRPVSVFFSDVRGFTAMSEQLSAEEVVHFLNTYYFDTISTIILQHDGTLDKYIGDAVMAVWNAPLDQDDHAYKAVQCAIDCQRAFAVMNQKLSAEGKQTVNVGMGVNSGEAVVGNIGSRDFMDYTVIGDAVNTASRLQNQSKAGEITISESTYQLVKGRVSVSEPLEVMVKGKEKPIRIYKVLY